jgi:preprotein translocase subunit SecG
MSHVILLADFWHIFFGITMTLTAIFLILLVLVQRGRGGGLAGAFGGMGGQSAFGTKAGDMFTRVTIGVSLFWILLCVAAVRFLGSPTTGPFDQAEAPLETQVAPLGTEGLDGSIPPLPEPSSPGGADPASPAGETLAPGGPTTEGPAATDGGGESPTAPTD